MHTSLAALFSMNRVASLQNNIASESYFTIDNPRGTEIIETNTINNNNIFAILSLSLIIINPPNIERIITRPKIILKGNPKEAIRFLRSKFGEGKQR